MFSKNVRVRSVALLEMSSEDLERWVTYHGANNAKKKLQRFKKKMGHPVEEGDKIKAVLYILSVILSHRQLGEVLWRVRACTRQGISHLESVGCRVKYVAEESHLGAGRHELEVSLQIFMDHKTRHKDLRSIMDTVVKKGLPRASAIKALLAPRLKKS